jgi:integrase
VTTALDEVRTATAKVLSLPLDRWPDRDRDAWNAACRPATRLNPGGPAGHLKSVTRDDHARHYGCFLDFLDRRGLLRLHEPAAVNITPENIGAYVTERKDHVSSVTLHGSIARLRRAARFMAPDRDFSWLAEIEKDLALEMRPRSKAHRMVMIEVLAEAGLTLIHEAETSPSLSEIARARQVRDGLMVSLLAFCPIRLKNFTALEIGRSFVEVNGTWWIVLSASETKEHRPDERPVNELLTPRIERYLGQYRPVLARKNTSSSAALWLSSSNGAPMKDGSIRGVISATTLATVGVDVSPHLFRTAAASTIAIRSGDNPYLASALLHHTNPELTNAHYNRATSLTAAENFRQIVRQYEKK